MISTLRDAIALMTVAVLAALLLACAPQPGGNRASKSYLRWATFEVPVNEHVLHDVYETVLHEMGHALGIGGHSPDPADIMYAQASATASAGLSERDRATLAELYARPIGSRIVGGRGHH